jgi:hypothetical protein
MAHFAKLDSNNIVVFVTAGRDEDNGKENEISLQTGDTYKQTSYNTVGGNHLLGGTPFRKNYAGIGYTYDATRDAFIPQQPFQSWVLNEETCLWDAPVAMPTDDQRYSWDEETLSWVVIPTPTLEA